MLTPNLCSNSISLWLCLRCLCFFEKKCLHCLSIYLHFSLNLSWKFSCATVGTSWTFSHSFLHPFLKERPLHFWSIVGRKFQPLTNKCYEDELTRSLPRWHLCRGRPSPPSAAGLPPSLHLGSWKCPAANGTWCASAGRSWSRAEAAAIPNKTGSGGVCLLLPMKSNHGWHKLGHIDTVEGAPRSSGRGERPSPCCSRLATDARRRHAHLTAHGRRLTGSWKDAGRTDLLVAYLLPG